MKPSERALRNLLLAHPLPEEHLAEERTWETVRAAYAAREPVPRERRFRWRLLAALAVVGAAVAIGVSPAGSAISDWVRDRLGRERIVEVAPRERPALLRVPSGGSLLVTARTGAWVVAPDGSRRRLGTYTGATWSPHGRFVAAWRGRQLAALEPTRTGAVRWTISAPQPVLAARWAPSGFRVAYLSGSSLRVVAGDGTGDRELAAEAGRVAPAWRPGAEHVLAYVDAEGRLVVVDADSGTVQWRAPRQPRVLRLAWADDGRRLLVAEDQHVKVFANGRLLTDVAVPRAEATVTDAAVRPGGAGLVYATYARRTGQGTVFAYDGRASLSRFSGPGRFRGLAVSPDGSLVLVPWPEADEWVFVPLDGGVRPEAVGEVARTFDPGGPAASFPAVAGWVASGP